MPPIDKKSKNIPTSKATRGSDRPGPRKATRGGDRNGAGRPCGAQNKVTVELRDAAKVYTQDALDVLHKVCTRGKSEAARVTAACALLDRGHGKPRQQVDMTHDAQDGLAALFASLDGGPRIPTQLANGEAGN